MLVLAEGNYDIRFEGENLVELCVKMHIEFQKFQDPPQRLLSWSMGDEEKCVKGA